MKVTFTEVGTDAVHRTCDLCGKDELSGTTVLVKSGAETGTVRYGTDCAKRALAGLVGPMGAYGTVLGSRVQVSWRLPGVRSGRRFAMASADACTCPVFAARKNCPHTAIAAAVLKDAGQTALLPA